MLWADMFEVLWVGEGMFGVDSGLKCVCQCVCVRQVPTCPSLCLLQQDASNCTHSWWALALSLVPHMSSAFTALKENRIRA